MQLKHILAGLCLAAMGTTAAVAQDLGPTLSKIKDAKAITIGYRESSIPFSYLDDKQKPIGFAMDICYKIVDAVKAKLGMPTLEVNLTPVTSSTRIPLIANGTIDLECGSTTNNADRQKQVAFTQTYFLTANRVVSKKSSNIKSVEDLKGKTVVSTSGTTNIQQLAEANKAKSMGMNILAAKDHAEAFLMVETGRAVGFAMDDVLLASLAASSKTPTDFVITPDAFNKPEPYGIMLPKGDPQFKALVDQATTALYISPDMAKLWAKWFTSPIPPTGINLNMPMDATMTKAFAHPTDSPNTADY
ncbi:MAG TPA: amino acid ABC transporter substrate-binding protein [Bordetella sp.]